MMVNFLKSSKSWKWLLLGRGINADGELCFPLLVTEPKLALFAGQLIW